MPFSNHSIQVTQDLIEFPGFIPVIFVHQGRVIGYLPQTGKAL